MTNINQLRNVNIIVLYIQKNSISPRLLLFFLQASLAWSTYVYGSQCGIGQHVQPNPDSAQNPSKWYCNPIPVGQHTMSNGSVHNPTWIAHATRLDSAVTWIVLWSGTGLCKAAQWAIMAKLLNWTVYHIPQRSVLGTHWEEININDPPNYQINGSITRISNCKIISTFQIFGIKLL